MQCCQDGEAKHLEVSLSWLGLGNETPNHSPNGTGEWVGRDLGLGLMLVTLNDAGPR